MVVHYGCSDDDISSRANVEIYRNFRPISLCDSKSPQATTSRTEEEKQERERETNFDLHKTTITMTKWSRTLD